MSLLLKNGIACILGIAIAGGACAAEPVSADAGAHQAPDRQNAPSAHVKKRPKQEVNWYTTPGWKLMTPDERSAYRDKLHATKSFEECQAVVHQTHQELAERAKASGKSIGVESDKACKRLSSKMKP